MRFAPILLCWMLGVGVAVAAPSDAPVPSGAGESAALPSDADALIAYVRRAIEAHDRDAMERLVNWDGVRPLRKRLTLLQISTSFGRPVKQAVVEDFPSDGLAEAEQSGKYKVNMPVVKTLRVVFDEPPGEGGEVPASVFLLGQKDGTYRIAVVNTSGQQRK